MGLWLFPYPRLIFLQKLFVVRDVLKMSENIYQCADKIL